MKKRQANYQQNHTTHTTTADQLHQKYGRYSFIRLIVFTLAIGVSIYLLSTNWMAAVGFIFVFLPLFYRFMRWHTAIQEAEQHHRQLAMINSWELDTLEGDHSNFPDGAAWVDAQHPYTVDLDIFGPYSVFQFANRCSTAIGERALANYLKEGVAIEMIKARQEAVAELSPLLPWRQDLQAYGATTEDQLEHIDLLQRWLDLTPFVSNNRWLQVAMYLMPFWGIGALVLMFFNVPIFLAALLFLLPIWIIRKTVDRVNEVHGLTTKAEEGLRLYARLMQHIEQASFESSHLQQLQAHFRANDRTASNAIQQLSYAISQLNVRYNAFAILLNLFGLWDLHWVWRLELWRAKQKALLPQWFEALAQFEALSSLAAIHYNNPDWQFPEIASKAPLEAIQLGHPLIHSSKRIGNNLDMPTQGHIKLITGSNMAGKSTFLRTVGLNIVLAMAGAPVCAKRFQTPPLQVYTSMRTQDALQESTSSFYAELKRLKFIIEAVERGDNIFFLLDEILKGTNSNDRHTGSKALIKQLIESGGGGLIATHDLELGALEAQYGGAIENLCLEVEIKDGKLYFDYTVKKGVSQSFNATLLMQEMGIRIGD